MGGIQLMGKVECDEWLFLCKSSFLFQSNTCKQRSILTIFITGLLFYYIISSFQSHINPFAFSPAYAWGVDKFLFCVKEIMINLSSQSKKRKTHIFNGAIKPLKIYLCIIFQQKTFKGNDGFEHYRLSLNSFAFAFTNFMKALLH